MASRRFAVATVAAAVALGGAAISASALSSPRRASVEQLSSVTGPGTTTPSKQVTTTTVKAPEKSGTEADKDDGQVGQVDEPQLNEKDDGEVGQVDQAEQNEKEDGEVGQVDEPEQSNGDHGQSGPNDHPPEKPSTPQGADG
jgi:hypothetical protein